MQMPIYISQPIADSIIKSMHNIKLGKVLNHHDSIVIAEN